MKTSLILQRRNYFQKQLIQMYSEHLWFRIVTNPLVIASLLVLMMSVLNFSGSSIGMYSHYFGQGKNDPELILGKPNAIRSDEWLVNSQMLVAQKSAGYPYINKNIGNGQNMSLVLDVPYKEWSTIFKPQNWIFFVTPFNSAFAFKWWSVLFILFSGAYLFTLHFLLKKKLIAILAALIFCLSPFVQWWLTPGTVLTLGFVFYIALLLLKIHEIPPNNVKKKVGFSVMLAYTMSCFALILYPPFQIPCILIVGFLYLSVVLRDRKNKNTWVSLSYIVGASIAALATVTIFLITRLTDVRSLLETSYPGTRVIVSGGLGVVHIFSTFIGPLLQDTSHALLYTDNQSESSNFSIPYITVLLLAVVILVVNYKIYRKINIPILAMVLIFCIFLTRMVIPFNDPIYGLLFLTSVPNLRLIIGLGLSSFVLLILIIKWLIDHKISLSPGLRWIVVLIVSITYSTIIFALVLKHPSFIPHTFVAALMLVTMVLFTWLLVNRKFSLSLFVLLGLTIVSVIHIHPIYRNTDILTRNPLSEFIVSEHKTNPSARWAVNNTIQLENFPAMNGAPSLTGVYTLPQNKLFQDLVPSVDINTINRYAHVQFHFDSVVSKPSITLLQADSFIVNINPCSPQLEKYNLKYIISTSLLDATCTKMVYNFTTQTTNPSNISIYKIQH